MSELRKDSLLDRYVIVAPDRSGRPQEFAAPTASGDPTNCPFCEGHESTTPEAVLTLPEDTDRWQVRVVPNKYPALASGQPPRGTPSQEQGDARPLWGAHEVIIETPHHATRAGMTDADGWHTVFRAYQQRWTRWASEAAIEYVSIFKNSGPLAGATLAHAHSQLMALPFVPPLVQEELAAACAYFEQHGRPYFADLLGQEIAQGVRMVAQTERFAAFCPFASRFPLETWVVPRTAGIRFAELDPASTQELAELMRTLLVRLENVLGNADYNYYLHTIPTTAPFDTNATEYYHWHLEICPRQARLAGFELGTSTYINPVVPERAAEILRHDVT